LWGSPIAGRERWFRTKDFVQRFLLLNDLDEKSNLLAKEGGDKRENATSGRGADDVEKRIP